MPKKCKKKMEALRFLHQILHTGRVDSPVMMWTQNRAVGGGGLDFFLLKWCNLAHSECSKIHYYQQSGA